MDVALANLSFSESKYSRKVSCNTSVNLIGKNSMNNPVGFFSCYSRNQTYTVTFWKRDFAKPPMTALAILPIPDWRGNRLAGRRPYLTSCSKNSIRWPAIASDLASVGAFPPVLSGRLLSTIAMILSVSIGIEV